MTIRIGTSGWQYRHWRKRFYPEALRQRDWLEYYAGVFDSVEVNGSFYRLPKDDDIARWCDMTPPCFRFSVKAPRSITHFKKLKNCEEQIGKLFTRLESFGERLGPVLFQLPPRWRCNVRRLSDFLAALPREGAFAFEFRDPSWHNEAVYEALHLHGAAFCIFDLDGATSPLETPGRFVYVRLHGPRASYTGNYRAPVLRTWAGRALGWERKGMDVHIYFDNDDRAYAARNAKRMLAMMEWSDEPVADSASVE